MDIIERLGLVNDPDFIKFADMAAANIRDYLPKEYFNSNVRVDDIKKQNGLKLKALIVESPKSNAAPCIYLENYFEDYREGFKNFSDIMEEIAQTRLEYEPSQSLNVGIISDYSQVKERIIPQLLNAEQNLELLSQRPHKMMGDLAVVFAIETPEEYNKFISLGEGVSATIPVTNQMMSLYNVSVDEMYKTAVENIKPNVRDMVDIMAQMMPDMPLDFVPRGQMVVVSNSANTKGASAVLSPETDRQLKEIFGGQDYMILPSSIHEAIAVPSGNLNPKDMADMVKEINGNEVLPEEVLSDNVYSYNPQTMSLTKMNLDSGRSQTQGQTTKRKAMDLDMGR